MIQNHLFSSKIIRNVTGKILTANREKINKSTEEISQSLKHTSLIELKSIELGNSSPRMNQLVELLAVYQSTLTLDEYIFFSINPKLYREILSESFQKLYLS